MTWESESCSTAYPGHMSASGHPAGQPAQAHNIDTQTCDQHVGPPQHGQAVGGGAAELISAWGGCGGGVGAERDPASEPELACHICASHP